MRKIFITILLFSSVLSAQTYQPANGNIFIQDSMKLGTSTNSVWIDTIKAGSIIISHNGIDYVMDGVEPVTDTSNYYVDAVAGNDDSSGNSIAKAWKTLAKIETVTLEADDTVFLKNGGEWRETLELQNSGTAGNHITFTNYGAGKKPEILGSELATGFINQSGNIWYAVTVLTSPPVEGTSVWLEETDGSVSWCDSVIYDAAKSRLDAEYKFTWNDDTLFIYAATDPDTRYTNVEVGQRGRGFWLSGEEYITIDGINMFYMISGVDELQPTADLTGLEIRNCKIGWLGERGDAGYGIHAVYSDMIVEYDTIHDTGRRSVSLVNFGPDDISNILVQFCELYNGNHTTGVDCNAGSTGGSSGNIDSIVIRNNYIHDDEDFDPIDESEYCWIRSTGNGTGTVDTVYVYNNIFEFTQNHGLYLGGVARAYVYNNTFYGTNDNNTSLGNQIYIADASKNVEIKNNIFYTDHPTEVNGAGELFYSDGIDEVDIDADYNLYWRINDGHRIITINWPEHFYRTAASFASYKATYSPMGANSPDPADPTFTDGANSNFHLQTGSDAIDAGVAWVHRTTDYEGVAVGSPPNIGAFETIEDP